MPPKLCVSFSPLKARKWAAGKYEAASTPAAKRFSPLKARKWAAGKPTAQEAPLFTRVSVLSKRGSGLRGIKD